MPSLEFIMPAWVSSSVRFTVNKTTQMQHRTKCFKTDKCSTIQWHFTNLKSGQNLGRSQISAGFANGRVTAGARVEMWYSPGLNALMTLPNWTKQLQSFTEFKDRMISWQKCNTNNNKVSIARRNNMPSTKGSSMWPSQRTVQNTTT